MNIDEAKVREAMQSFIAAGEGVVSLFHEGGMPDIANGVDEALTVLKDAFHEAIAPEQPEIPEGCPVIIWDDVLVDTEAFYIELIHGKHVTSLGVVANVKIDYQRKGHVIPWGGGECPVDEKTMVDAVLNDGSIQYTMAGDLFWHYKVDKSEQIVAYSIRPEWVKS